MQIFPYIELGVSTAGGKTVEAYTDTYTLSMLKTIYKTGKGQQSYESPGWINGDFLYFSVPSGVEVAALGYRQTGYAISGEGAPFLGDFDGTVAHLDSITDTSGLTERGKVMVNGQTYILLTTDKAGIYHVQAS